MPHYPATLPNPLFSRYYWNAVERNLINNFVNKIEAISENELLDTSTEELTHRYAKKFKFEVPVIHDDQIDLSQKEAKIDVRHDPLRGIFDRSQPCYIDGVTVNVKVPFTGNREGFDIQPSTRSLNRPSAEIGNGIIKFSISGVDLTEEVISDEIKSTLDSIKTYLGWLSGDVGAYNAKLEEIATQIIDQRKERILKNRSLLADIEKKVK